MKRREALKTLGISAAGSFVFPHFSFADSLKDIGLQLYTVRNLLDKEFESTIKAISELGFRSLETFAGSKGHFWGYSPGELKNLLVDNDLRWVSMHIPLKWDKINENALNYASVTQNIDLLAATAANLGIKYLVCPYLAKEDRETLDQYKKLAVHLNTAAAACKKEGLGFAYHNHDFEFLPIEGQLPMQVLLNNTDPELVKFEMDVFWVVKAGQNPISWIKNNPGRYKMAHIKDMDKSPEKGFTEVGSGSIDYQSFLKEAKIVGLQHYFVEQDKTPGNPLDSIAKSFNYLKTLNF